MRIAALILLGACLPTLAADDSDDGDLETPVLVDPKVLRCSPGIVRAGQSITLTLGPGHGKELSIHGPKKLQIYFVVVGSPPGDDPQLMSTDEFEKATSVTIPTNLMARPWVANGSIERVFSTPGRYSFYVSENLESEVGGYECAVEYRE